MFTCYSLPPKEDRIGGRDGRHGRSRGGAGVDRSACWYLPI